MTSTEPIAMIRRGEQNYALRMALIVIAAVLLYLAGNASVHLWDRDEAWYCQTSKQMLESGDWVIPHFLGDLRTTKPIFIYWLQATSMSILGPTVFAARLVSVIAMTVTLIVLLVALTRATGPRRAMWTTFIFSTSILVIAAAKMCVIDSTLLVLAVGMQICIYRLYRASGIRRPVGWGGVAAANVRNGQSAKTGTLPTAIVFWILTGVAVLAKGPVPLVNIFMAMLMLALMDVGRQWRSAAAWRRALSWWPSTRPIIGIAIVLLIAGPWIVTAWQREPEFVRRLLGEPGRHLASNQAGHSQLPGYFTATVWLMYFPWSLFLPTALVMGFKHRGTPHIRFALAIVMGNWCFAEMMVTKLPHYVLPSYASLAFLTATALIRYWRHPAHKDLHTTAYNIGVAAWGVGALILAAVPWIAMLAFKDFSYVAAGAFTAAGIVYATVVCCLLYQRRLVGAVTAMGIGMLGMISILYAAYLPRADYFRLPQRAGAALQSLGAVGEGRVIMIDYDEPSLGYYQGGTIRAQEKDAFWKMTPSEWPEWIVITPKVYDRLSNDRKATLEIARRLRGFNYNTSQTVADVLIARNRSAAVTPPTTGKTQ